MGSVRKQKKQANITYVCSPSYEVWHQESGLQQMPWMDKGSQLFHHPKGKGERNLIPKRKSAGEFCFIWDDQKHQTPSPGSCEWQRGTAASHTPAARGRRFQVGADFQVSATEKKKKNNQTCPPSLLIAGKIRKSECVSAVGAKYLKKTHTVFPDKLHNLLWRKSVVCMGCLAQKGNTCGTHRKTPGTKNYRLHTWVHIFRCTVR